MAGYITTKTPSQDAQGRWWEQLSPTQTLSGLAPLLPRDISIATSQQQTKKKKQKKKSKCHGDVKLHHLKHKWRAQGLSEGTIQAFVQNRKQYRQQRMELRPCNDNRIEVDTTTVKRKRDRSSQASMHSSAKSLNQLSLSPRCRKRPRTMIEKAPSLADILCNVTELDVKLQKFSKYLKMPRYLLLRSLQLQLNCRLKQEDEQNYIIRQLQLIDGQFCVDRIRYLYQSYLDLGSSAHIWPICVINKVPENHQHLTGRYIQNYLHFLNEKLNQYNVDLQENRRSRPHSMSVNTEKLDLRLYNYVRLHHLNLLRLSQYQLNRFKNDIQENRLLQQLEKYSFTNEQRETIDRLISIRDEQLKVFEQMTLFQQRILCHRLPRSFDQMNENITDHTNHTHMLNKNVQETKRQQLDRCLEKYETSLLDNEDHYQNELCHFERQLWRHHYSENRAHCDLIVQCVQNYLNHRQYRTIRTIRYEEVCVRTALRKLHRRQTSGKNHEKNKSIVDVYPQVILDVTKTSLNQRQLNYLSHRGPNYIRPNQSYLYPQSQRDKLIKRQYEDMINKVVPHLVRVHHIPSSAGVIKQLSEQLKTYMCEQYNRPISYLHLSHTRDELKLVQSIRTRLKRAGQILRVTDKGGIFHIGHIQDYDRKAEAYRLKTQAYEELNMNPLWSTFNRVVRLLNDLRAKKQIMAYQLEKMMPKRDKVALAYLYFVPKPHKEGTPLRPIVSSINTPASAISRFLDQTIRPIFDKHARTTTLIDGVDLIRRLQQYQNEGRLSSTTIFCTFDITDLYTMLPQEESLNVLIEFLLQHGYQKVKGIPIDTIRILAEIVIKENVFAYGKKFYRQIVGGAMGSAFTLTLANIFMWKWEQQLVQYLQSSHEIYGRYIDDIFLTWNNSIESLQQLLDRANCRHRNIKLVRQIGQIVPFLDVLVENRNGIVSTKVYHKSAAEPYIAPFQSDHPRHVFANIVETALLRALRYSSTLANFIAERRFIQLMLLYNGYPPEYIQKQLKHFQSKHLQQKTTRLVTMTNDQIQYDSIRSMILGKPTRAEYQTLSRISKLEQKATHDETYTNKWDRCLIIHYNHERRFTAMKKQIHQLWNKLFANTSIPGTRLIIGNRNNRNTKRELTQTRPALQTNQPTTS